MGTSFDPLKENILTQNPCFCNAGFKLNVATRKQSRQRAKKA